MATAAPDLEKNERIFNEVTALKARTGEGITQAFESYGKETGMHPATAAKHYYAHNKLVKAGQAGNGTIKAAASAAAPAAPPKPTAAPPKPPRSSGVQLVADEKPKTAAASTSAHRPADPPEIIPIPDPAPIAPVSATGTALSERMMEWAGEVEVLEAENTALRERLAKFEALTAFLREG